MRVALVRLSAMGDVTQSLGAAQSLRRARPDWDVHFVTQRPFSPLLEGLGFTTVIAHDRDAGGSGLRATRRALRALQLDVAVDLQGNWKSAWVTRGSGAGDRFGARRPHRQEPASAILLPRRVPIPGPNHPAEVAFGLLRGLVPDLEERPARLVATAAELDAVRARVAARRVDPERPFCVFVVTDPADNRSWWPVAMARQAEREATPVLWLRGPAEQSVALPGDVAVLDQGQGSVRELVALGVLVASVGGRVLGPDQGATHVLCAAGAETHVFFGPQDPVCTAPRGAVVHTRSDGPTCVPCRSRRCRHDAGPVCMDFVI